MSNQPAQFTPPGVFQEAGPDTPRTNEIIVEGHTQDDVYRLLHHARTLERELNAVQSETAFNTPVGPNRDVSAGTSHSEPDGSATKPAIPSSQGGASQGAGPIPSERRDDILHDAQK